MFSIVFSVLLTSCTIYQPIVADIPLISKKNDLRVDAAVTLLPSMNATVSYGLTNNIAVQVYGRNHGPDYYFQGAAGYYKELGNKITMEAYTGFGYGFGTSDIENGLRLIEGNYQTYFEQFNIGKTNLGSLHLDYGIGLKFGLLHSNFYDTYNIVPIDTKTIPILYADNSLLLEPTAFLRFGGEKLKFSIKLGYCWINKFTNINEYFPYDNLTLGVGLNYRL